MAYALPSRLPLDRIIKVWEPAEEALARLDQALAGSALKGAWLARADFEEAAAALWLEGELVPLEDLVLDDASTNARTPTHQLYQARAVLLSRRSLARQEPKKALTLQGILALQERRERLDGPSPEAEALLDQDPNWNTEGRIHDWLALLPALEAFPALPAAAVAWHAWEAIEPFQRHNATLGRLLAPVLLWQRGKIDGQILCLGAGLKRLRWLPRQGRPLQAWIEEFCQAVALAAQQGLKAHQQLQLAEALMTRRLEGRRRSSRLPDVARLVLDHPLVSAPMVAEKLKISQQAAGSLLEEFVGAGALRELTGRSRFRAFGLA
jgi:hypothetical protein